MKKTLFFLLVCSTSGVVCWSSNEPKGEQAVFFGSLRSREGNDFMVTNIVVGKSPDGTEKIILYEKPKEVDEEQKLILVNPYKQLTTTDFDLMKIDKIAVPNPDVTWTWKNTESKRPTSPEYEFIELTISWKNSGTITYLLETGMKGTNKPVKLFCDVVNREVQTTQQNKTLFCKGIPQTDLRQKGAPFPSIKEVVIENHCFKMPVNVESKPTQNGI